jgi:large repetitive protein
MRRTLFVAVFVLFPMIAAAQSSITISPDRIAYNTEGTIMTISGTGLAGNVQTLVDFTYGDGGVAEVPALTASSTTVTVEVPLSVTGLPGAWAVTVVAVDDNGTRVAGPATLTIFANLPPSITVPEVVTAEATSASGANVTFDVGGFSFVDPPPAPTITCTPASGSLFALGSTIVSCTATDSFGSSHASFTVFVGDTTPPVITVPANFISSTQVVTYSVSATDAVSGSVAVSCSPASGSTFPIGVTQVNCSATDSHDNVGFASFFVSVQAPPPPTLTLPTDFTVTTFSPSGTPVGWDASADQDATVVCSPAVGSNFPVGTTTVTCSATGIFGTTATGSFHVTVVLDQHPVIVTPGDIEVDATSPSGAVVTYVVTATDIVDGTIAVTCTPPSGSTFPIGSNVVQCSATNSRNITSFASFAVIVRQPGSPVLALPGNITVASDGPSGTVVTFDASALDDVDGALEVTCTPPSGSTFPNGVTTVTCSATDSDNHTTTGSFTVTVGDNVPPVVTVPPSILAEATGPGGAVVTFSASAVDNIDGSVPVTCSPTSNSLFPIGVTTVTCTAQDSSGNVGMASFNVTVQDTTPPTLHLPGPITATADAACTAVVTYTATATDVVDGTDSVTCTPASGSTFTLGTTTVNCSSTDAHGNTALGSFTVTVNDTTPPTIQSVTATPNNLWPDDHRMVNVTLAVVAVDNCDTAPVNRITNVAANQPITGPGSGNTTPDYIITGDLTLQLRAERTQGVDRTYTITVTSTDFSGNTSTTTTTVTVSQTNNTHGRAAGH